MYIAPNAGPFDLEKAKSGRPIQTLDGSKAKFVVHIPDAAPRASVVALVGDPYPILMVFSESGSAQAGEGANSNLVMVPPKKVHHTKWANMYGDGQMGKVYDTREEAELSCILGLEREEVTITTITWETEE